MLISFHPRWRKMRRALHENFSSKSVQTYQPMQATTAERAVLRMLGNTQSWDHHIKQ